MSKERDRSLSKGIKGFVVFVVEHVLLKEAPHPFDQVQLGQLFAQFLLLAFVEVSDPP